MSVKIDRLRCRVHVRSGRPAQDDRAKPAAPSLEFAHPQPISPQPRMDEATDDAHHVVQDAGGAARKADPNKVADRVYELMRKEMTDVRARGGGGKR